MSTPQGLGAIADKGDGKVVSFSLTTLGYWEAAAPFPSTHGASSCSKAQGALTHASCVVARSSASVM